MKLADLFSKLDKTVAYGGFVSAVGLLGFVIEKGYQDALGFSIQISSKAYTDAFPDFLKQAGSILLGGLKSPWTILILLLVTFYALMPSALLVRLTSGIRRGTAAWVAPPALLCLASPLVFYPATNLRNLLPDAFAESPFQLQPEGHSLSSSLRDMVVCAQVPRVSSRLLVLEIKRHCTASGFQQPEDARDRVETTFRLLFGVCVLAVALFAFAKWCAQVDETTAQPQSGVHLARLQVLTTLAAIGLALDAFGLCSFYGRVVRQKDLDEVPLSLVHSADAALLPCDARPGQAYVNGLILAETEKELAFLCSENLRVETISKTRVTSTDTKSLKIAPLTYVMLRMVKR
jgi:hypothetical protein